VNSINNNFEKGKVGGMLSIDKCNHTATLLLTKQHESGS
jgi:hypothetical protein